MEPITSQMEALRCTKCKQLTIYGCFLSNCPVKNRNIIDVIEDARYRDGGTIKYIDKDGNPYFQWWHTKKVYSIGDHQQREAFEMHNIVLNILDKFPD
jgi:hypothetical protein